MNLRLDCVQYRSKDPQFFNKSRIQNIKLTKLQDIKDRITMENKGDFDILINSFMILPLPLLNKALCSVLGFYNPCSIMREYFWQLGCNRTQHNTHVAILNAFPDKLINFKPRYDTPQELDYSDRVSKFFNSIGYACTGEIFIKWSENLAIDRVLPEPSGKIYSYLDVENEDCLAYFSRLKLSNNFVNISSGPNSISKLNNIDSSVFEYQNKINSSIQKSDILKALEKVYKEENKVFDPEEAVLRLEREKEERNTALKLKEKEEQNKINSNANLVENIANINFIGKKEESGLIEVNDFDSTPERENELRGNEEGSTVIKLPVNDPSSSESEQTD